MSEIQPYGQSDQPPIDYAAFEEPLEQIDALQLDIRSQNGRLENDFPQLNAPQFETLPIFSQVYTRTLRGLVEEQQDTADQMAALAEQIPYERLGYRSNQLERRTRELIPEIAETVDTLAHYESLTALSAQIAPRVHEEIVEIVEREANPMRARLQDGRRELQELLTEERLIEKVGRHERWVIREALRDHGHLAVRPEATEPDETVGFLAKTKMYSVEELGELTGGNDRIEQPEAGDAPTGAVAFDISAFTIEDLGADPAFADTASEPTYRSFKVEMPVEPSEYFEIADPTRLVPFASRAAEQEVETAPPAAEPVVDAADEPAVEPQAGPTGRRRRTLREAAGSEDEPLVISLGRDSVPARVLDQITAFAVEQADFKIDDMIEAIPEIHALPSASLKYFRNNFPSVRKLIENRLIEQGVDASWGINGWARGRRFALKLGEESAGAAPKASDELGSAAVAGAMVEDEAAQISAPDALVQPEVHAPPSVLSRETDPEIIRQQPHVRTLLTSIERQLAEAGRNSLKKSETIRLLSDQTGMNEAAAENLLDDLTEAGVLFKTRVKGSACIVLDPELATCNGNGNGKSKPKGSENTSGSDSKKIDQWVESSVGLAREAIEELIRARYAERGVEFSELVRTLQDRRPDLSEKEVRTQVRSALEATGQVKFIMRKPHKTASRETLWARFNNQEAMDTARADTDSVLGFAAEVLKTRPKV